MKRHYKILLTLGVLPLVIFFIYSIGDFNTESEGVETESKTQENSQETSVKYFSSGDRIIIEAGTQNLYTDNPVTTLTYYAVDSSNKPVPFREGDRAFVRILGVTHLFTNNTEIFHPEISGSKDYTLFSGEVCLGKSIKLNSEGTMIWPWGCFEDHTSVEIKVYEKSS
jgi:hypothetical protein